MDPFSCGSEKSEPHFTSGAKHVFVTMQLIKTQPKDIQKVVKPVVQRNTYFTHSVNLLAAMLADSDGIVREQAVRTIQRVRSKPSKQRRKFSLPQLHWEAQNTRTSYVESVRISHQ